MRILLVDDSAPARRDIRSLLVRRPGWLVCGEAADGSEAIEKVRDLHPDLILMDVCMPRMDGLQATRAILREFPRTKIILVTHNDPTLARQQAAETDARGSVSKLRLSADLVPLIESVVQGESDIESTEESLRMATEFTEEEVRARTMELRDRTRELEVVNAEIIREADALRDFSARLLRVHDDERRRIARDLYDGAGQMLAMLSLEQSRMVTQLQGKFSGLAKQIENQCVLTSQISREIRSTSYLLHPPMLDQTGLLGALQWYIEGLTARSALAIALDIDKDLGRLPADTELAIFRIVQECLTNIQRHSGSKDASIRITRDENRIAVEVRDHGAGMSPERLIEIQSQCGGIGVRGMRERLRQFRGELTIESGPSGTNVRASLPLVESENQREPTPARSAAAG